MSILEAADLVKAMEDKFGVSAAAPRGDFCGTTSVTTTRYRPNSNSNRGNPGPTVPNSA